MPAPLCLCDRASAISSNRFHRSLEKIPVIILDVRGKTAFAMNTVRDPIATVVSSAQISTIRKERIRMKQTKIVSICRSAVGFALTTIMLLSAVAAQGTTVTLWNSNVNAQTQEWYRTVFKPAFEAAYPGTTLELAFHAFDTFYDKILVSAAAGVAPDVVTSNNPLFFKEGLVIDLSDMLKT
jgi:maltose-binding protein MalE